MAEKESNQQKLNTFEENNDTNKEESQQSAFLSNPNEVQELIDKLKSSIQYEDCDNLIKTLNMKIQSYIEYLQTMKDQINGEQSQTDEFEQSLLDQYLQFKLKIEEIVRSNCVLNVQHDIKQISEIDQIEQQEQKLLELKQQAVDNNDQLIKSKCDECLEQLKIIKSSGASENKKEEEKQFQLSQYNFNMEESPEVLENKQAQSQVGESLQYNSVQQSTQISQCMTVIEEQFAQIKQFKQLVKDENEMLMQCILNQNKEISEKREQLRDAQLKIQEQQEEESIIEHQLNQINDDIAKTKDIISQQEAIQKQIMQFQEQVDIEEKKQEQLNKNLETQIQQQQLDNQLFITKKQQNQYFLIFSALIAFMFGIILAK